MNHQEAIPGCSAGVLDEVQVGLFELAGACDFLSEGGDPLPGLRRVTEALKRIQRAVSGLRKDAAWLLMALGEAEGGPEARISELRCEAKFMTDLVAPRGRLDRLLDQLDNLREGAGREGEWLRQDVRVDLLAIRAHLHEVHQNHTRITGRPIQS